MAFSSVTSTDQIKHGMSATMLLNASCQSVLDAYFRFADQLLCQQIRDDVRRVRTLAGRWREESGQAYQYDVLIAIRDAGIGFDRAKEPVDALFDSLLRHFDPQVKSQLVAEISHLQRPVAAIVQAADRYLAALRQFQMDMTAAEEGLRRTVAEMQAHQQDIQAQIKKITGTIQSLVAEISADRTAIAAAQKEKALGIAEIVFGILFVPMTGGASLLLAGIGVASFDAADQRIAQLDEKILLAQQAVVDDQQTLDDDQRMIATLSSLTMSTGFIITDMDGVQPALDALRTGWAAFNADTERVTADIAKATSSDALALCQAWFDTACAEWVSVTDLAASLSRLDTTAIPIPIGAEDPTLLDRLPEGCG